MKLKDKIESLLFVSSKPLTVKKISDITEKKSDEVKDALEELVTEYDERNGGLVILRNNNEFQISTSPDASKLIKEFLKDETFGELTRPSLETLTIVAYRGPLTKAELEQIRGVNCSLILRNLMIRGLVEIQEDKYVITMDFLRYLGLKSVEDLPGFEKLNSDENLQKLIDKEEVQPQA